MATSAATASEATTSRRTVCPNRSGIAAPKKATQASASSQFARRLLQPHRETDRDRTRSPAADEPERRRRELLRRAEHRHLHSAGSGHQPRRDDAASVRLVDDVDGVVLAVRPGDASEEGEPAPEAEPPLARERAGEHERAPGAPRSRARRPAGRRSRTPRTPPRPGAATRPASAHGSVRSGTFVECHPAVRKLSTLLVCAAGALVLRVERARRTAESRPSAR